MVSRAKFGVNGWIVWMGRPAQEGFIDKEFRLGELRRNILRRYKDWAAVLRIGNRGL
jgi:hypothetical protein